MSPFPDKIRRVTEQTATIRNRLVVDMADAVVVAHATPGGKTESLCREALSSGKQVFTFDDPANAELLRSGAKLVDEMAII